MGKTFTTLADLVRQVEARLLDSGGQAGLGLVLLDRVDVSAAAPEALAHKGIGVQAPQTENSGEYRDQGLARVEDRLQVTLAYRVRPKAQKASRDEALDLEEQIRIRLTDDIALREMRIHYLGSTRGPHPKSSEWYVITQAFSAQRDALLGGR